MQPVSSMFGAFTLNSVGISLFLLSLSLPSLSFSFSMSLKPSLTLFICFTDKLCSSLFSPLLKTKLSLVLVSFLSFLLHFVHSSVQNYSSIQFHFVSPLLGNVMLCARTEVPTHSSKQARIRNREEVTLSTLALKGEGIITNRIIMPLCNISFKLNEARRETNIPIP